MPLHFDVELDHFKQHLLRMGGQAEDAVQRAIQAVIERDDDRARQVKEDDRVLDQAEIEVDDLAIHLLAKAPLASDLRLITVGMKVSLDLERVGDEATTIARRGLELNREPPLPSNPEIARMADIATEMLKAALDAFVHRDPAKARDVIPRDKDVDGLNKRLDRELVALMIQKPETISRCLCWMRIVRSLERIADHATNIAEEVVYLNEGRDIRHSGHTGPDRNSEATA